MTVVFRVQRYELLRYWSIIFAKIAKNGDNALDASSLGRPAKTAHFFEKNPENHPKWANFNMLITSD